MRRGLSAIYYLLGDHLGSTSKVANSDGLSVNSQQLYMPWGEDRYYAYTSSSTFRYTGQRQDSSLGPADGEGLYYYNARWLRGKHPALAPGRIPGAGNFPWVLDWAAIGI